MSSQSSTSTSPTTHTECSKWQILLKETCKALDLDFNYISDRRGCRTAWSAYIIIGGKKYHARFWYDGDFLNNAREDAAEVALMEIWSGTSHNASQTLRLPTPFTTTMVAASQTAL